MRIFLTVLFFNLTSFVYSQGDQIVLKILPDKTTTNDRVVFKGTIINNSKKTFKAIPLSFNCNKHNATVFWDLKIYKDGIKFYDFSYDMIISNPPYPIKEEIHLKKNSQFEFKLCVNLNWLISDSDLRQFLKERTRYSNNSRIYQPLMPKDYHNPDSGTYSIQLVYPSRIDKSIDTLVSNSVFIKYTGRINNK